MSDALVSAIAEMNTMLINLDISNQNHDDGRDFTCFDLIDALELAKNAVLLRANDNPNQYNSDGQRGYPMLYNSIMEDVKEAIRINHQTNGRTQRFVILFNNLVVEKMMIALRTAGPEQMGTMIEVIVDTAKRSVLDNDVPAHTSILFRHAQETLHMHNRQRLEKLQTA